MNINKEIRKPLSDSNILKLVNGKANIMVYENLIHCKSIDEILKPCGACFLLYQNKPNFGHWCLIFKLNKNTLEFFDPYGYIPDSELKFVPQEFRKLLNEDHTYLLRLLYNSPYNIDYNEHRLQELAKNINTCGRWCVVRLWCKKMKLQKFANLFNCGDKLITILTI